MRVFHAMSMFVGVVAEEDETLLLQVHKLSRSSSVPPLESDICVNSRYENCKGPGTLHWNGRMCCYPSHYTCESMTESSCNDIWTGYVCCKSGCENSEGVAIMDTNMEDCTNKDFYLWDKDIRADAKNVNRKNVSDSYSLINLQGEQGWKNSCIAHINSTEVSQSQSCDEWCKGNGLQCVMAMDDASVKQQEVLQAWQLQEGDVVSKCAVGDQYWTDTHGCSDQLTTQICACETTTTTTPSLVAVIMALDANVKDCTNAINLQGEKSLFTAHITSTESSQSCSNWCEGHGLQCVEAMADASTSQQQVAQCSLGEQTLECDTIMSTQICACDTTTTTTTLSCQNSQGKLITTLDPNMEDCTNEDFYVWREGTQSAQNFSETNVSASWSRINLQGKASWTSSCIAHVTSPSGKLSCDQWCQGNGLQCVMAMDDASVRQQQVLGTWLKDFNNVVSQCSLGNQYWQNTHGCADQFDTHICACDLR